MGIIKRGILGGFRKKVANVVGSSWKGIAVIKSLPLSVANPNTIAQQFVRSKFRLCSRFASSILSSTIKPLWDRYAQQMSGYNMFVRRNIDVFNAINIIDPQDLKISEGIWGICVPQIGQVSIVNQTILVGWSASTSLPNQAMTDIVFIVVARISDNKVVAVSSSSDRQDLSSTIPVISPIILGDDYYVWMATQDVTGRNVSNTTYYTFST